MISRKRVPLSAMPAAGNIWQISDLRGGRLVILAYLAPEMGLLTEETLKTRKYLSFNPNPTFWGESRLTRLSEVYVDRDGDVRMIFRNKPSMPIFYFTSKVNCPSKILLATVDDEDKIRKRYLISYTPEETIVTGFYIPEDGQDAYRRRSRIIFSRKDPGYILVDWFPAK